MLMNKLRKWNELLQLSKSTGDIFINYPLSQRRIVKKVAGKLKSIL